MSGADDMAGLMADVSNLSSAQFQRDPNPNRHPARRALEVALDEFDHPGEGGSPEHVIVIMGWNDGEAGDARYLQSGSFGSFAQAGLAACAARKLGA